MVAQAKSFFIGIKKLILEVNLKGLSGKMILLAIAPVALMSIGAVVILLNMQMLTKELTSILTDTVPSLTTSKDLVIEMKTMDLSIWRAFYLKNSPDDAQAFAFDFEDSYQRFNSDLERYMKLDMPEVASKIRSSANDKWKSSSTDFEKFKKLLSDKKFDEAIKTYESNIKPKFSEMSEVLSNVELNNVNLVESEKASAEKISNKITTKSIVIACITVALFSFFAALFITGKITEKLLSITHDLNIQSDITKEQTKEMAVASKTLADSSSEAASAIHETSAAMEEIRTMIHKSNSNAKSTSETSQESVVNLRQGKSAMEEIKKSFVEIKNSNETMMKAVENNNNRITEIIDVINSINSKTAIINEIVFQTKLLSFNASVEAARAGESGKGFAVVAEEVGNLAVNSGVAAKEIADLLKDSHSMVASIVSQSKASMSEVAMEIGQRVDASEKSIEASMILLDQLQEKSQNVNQLVMEISNASNEQIHGVDEVTGAIGNLNVISNQNKDESQRIAKSAEIVLEKAEIVNTISSRLKSIVQG